MSCVLTWGHEARRGLSRSPLGGTAQGQPRASPPRLALPPSIPPATSVASNANTCPQISSEPQSPHWRDRGGYRLCGLLSASHSPGPGRGGWADSKTLSGKTGSAPSRHPHALPSAVGLASAKAPVGIWALISPEGSPPLTPQSPPGHLQVVKQRARGLGGSSRWRLKVWLVALPRSGTLRN